MTRAKALVHLFLWGMLVLGVPSLFLSTSIPVQAGVAWSPGRFLSQVLPDVLGLLLVAGVAAWLAAGLRALRHAGSWCLGSREESTAALASRALAAASRATLSMGVVAPLFMLVTLGAGIARAKADPASLVPAMSRGFSGVMIAPLFALLLGRGVFGALSARAASIAGLPADRSLRGWSGFAVPLLIVVITCLLLLTTITRLP